MTLILMATGVTAWLVARSVWSLAGAAHRSTERRAAAGSQLGAPRRGEQRSADA